MTTHDFTNLWDRLPASTDPRHLSALEAIPTSGIWAARDMDNHPVILVALREQDSLPHMEVHGLAITTDTFHVHGIDGTHASLTCLEPSTLTMFEALADDITTELTDTPINARAATITSVLNRWRWFWTTTPTPLSDQDAVGLFGELWFLIRWLNASPAAVDGWTASEGANHDFELPGMSIEVKTTAKREPIVHHIQHLDQLADPDEGELHLYSLRLIRDPAAHNNVHLLVEHLLEQFHTHPDLRQTVCEQLATRGYRPRSQDGAAIRYRVADEALYHVTDDFPRLTQEQIGSIPDAITSVSYTLAMAACGPWLEATRPDQWTTAPTRERTTTHP